MPNRTQKLLCCIDPAHQVGAEIGPLDKAIVTREMGQIYYIDHDTTEVLRARFSEPGHSVKVDQIADVDYVWGEKNLAELLQDKAPIDYVIASHVIEHVPDFIGWLNEVRSILKPGGILSLAIPDKRQCFDYSRPTTRLSEIVEAYLQQSRKPSLRQIFDHVASTVSYRDCIAWSGATNEAHLAPLQTIETAWNATKNASITGAYCDVHCWVFTPLSFFELLSEVAAVGFLNFEIAQFYETEGCEFFVSLRATDVPKAAEIKHFATALAQKTTSPKFSETILQELRFLKRKIKAVISP